MTNLPVPHQPGAQVPAMPAGPGAAGMPGWGPAPMGPAPLFGGVSAEQKLELLEYWRSVTKRKWAILALAAAVAVLAALVAMAMTPIYRATATVLIEAGKGKIVAVEEVYSISQQREHYQTQVEIIKSREVAQRTVKALKLWENPEFDPRKAQPSWTQRALAAVGLADKPDLAREWTEEELVAVATRRLQGSLFVTPVRLSQLVRVEFESADKALAARIANAVAEQYIENEKDERYRMTTDVSQQLQERLATLRQKLADSEKALQAYRESKGLVNLGGSAAANAGQQLTGMTERMMQARTRRIELEATYNQAKSTEPAAYGTIPAVARDAAVLDAQRVVNSAESKLGELQSRLGPAHDQVRTAEAELSQARAILQQRQTAVVRTLTREYEAARDTEVAFDRGLAAARGTAQGVNREEFQLAVLDREYQSNRQLYEMFMSRAKETSLVGDVQPSMARITDAAIAPVQAVKPNRRNIVLVATLLALLLGAAAAITIDRLDSTVKGSEDAERRLHMPVLATLPQVSDANRKTMARMFLEQAHSQFSEGIRTARTGVMLSSLDAPSKVLLITSSVPGEGKTTVAVNMAIAHAHTGTRTLLIDCDMRRAQASRALGKGSAVRGLTALVSGQATAEDCIVPVRNTGLFMLPVGETPPNPLELLLSQRFKDMLEALKTQYPVIIIDSPPVELVSEALVLAPLATNVALVVKAMSTPAPLVRKTQQRLARAGGKMLGIILNGMNYSDARRYYGEYAYSSYSYGYDGYGAKPGDDEAEADDGDASAAGSAGNGSSASKRNGKRARIKLASKREPKAEPVMEGEGEQKSA